MGFIKGKPDTPNQQGWKQFLSARKKMLGEYDRAKDLEVGHLVKVEHGNVGEAYFRKWLTEFLPKRYGVTSGYIISPGLTETDQTYHYDVIIYDQLESPILWRSNNPDDSSQGESLAIPAEYVFAVFEVKSRYNYASMKKAIDHILKLKLLVNGLNPDPDGQNLFLPNNFFWGLVFFEILPTDLGNINTLNQLIEGIEIRGFMGGIVLRYEKYHDQSGSIHLATIRGDHQLTPKPDNYSNTIDYYGNRCIFGHHFTSSSFTEFAMNILMRLNPQGGYKRYASGGPDIKWVE